MHGYRNAQPEEPPHNIRAILVAAAELITILHNYSQGKKPWDDVLLSLWNLETEVGPETIPERIAPPEFYGHMPADFRPPLAAPTSAPADSPRQSDAPIRFADGTTVTPLTDPSPPDPAPRLIPVGEA